jgi:NAD(P)H-hydrate epimerase
VVLKGPGTIIAGPDGTAFVDVMGTAALATAGTGDVLTGIIAAVLCRSGDAVGAQAVAAAVFLHGLAGRLAGRRGRPATAWDVVEAVPAAVADLSG